VCRYLVLNPVRVKMAERPEDWSWSSDYRWIFPLQPAGSGQAHWPALHVDQPDAEETLDTVFPVNTQLSLHFPTSLLNHGPKRFFVPVDGMSHQQQLARLCFPVF